MSHVYRYTFFIVLYPMGVAGELLTIYAALPYVQKTGLYSVTLPNKYNFSFDYYTFLILTMVSYIPCKYVFMYNIMILALRFLAWCPWQVRIETCLPRPQCSLSSTSTCCGRGRRFWVTWKSTAKWNKHAASAPHNVDWPYGGKGGGKTTFPIQTWLILKRENTI